MKCLQTTLVASALLLCAAAANASSADSAHADSLMSGAFTQQDTPQSGIRHGDSRNADDSSDSSVRSNGSDDTSGRLPATNGKSADPSPSNNVRAPSWQSLLPGSIQ